MNYPKLLEWDGVILEGAPCCCYACDQERQPGHYMCEGQPTPELLEAEERGEIHRQLNPSGWRWYVNN